MRRRGGSALLLGTVALAVVTPVTGVHATSVVAPAGCDGVTVLVAPPGVDDQVRCVAAGPTAGELFEDAGHDLTRVQRFPGAVCRVNGIPADQACVAMPPADRYWGFFHAAGPGWDYATMGVDSVVPEPGDSIALAWQDTEAPVAPSTLPATLGPESPGDSGPSAAGDVAGDAAGDAADERGDVGLPTGLSVLAVIVLLGGAVVLGVRRSRP